MSLQLLDSQSEAPAAVTSAIAVDVTGDITAGATIVEQIPMTIAIDITGDISSAAFTPFVAPEPGCTRIAVITH